LRANLHRTDLDLPYPGDPLLQRAIKSWWVYLDHEIPPSKIIDFAVEPATPV